MNYGFIKVAAASPKVIVADTKHNAREIIAAAETAASRGVKLLVTPELGVTAYTCGDLFLQRRLITAADAAVGEIAAATAGLDMLLVIGAPVRRGASLFNCALVVYHGEVLGVVPKTNIPNYGEFYELRHFTPAPECGGTIVVAGQEVPFGTDLVFSCREMPEFSFGCEICEDLWVPAPPSVRLAEAGAMIICNLSASDETVGKAAYRRSLVADQSARLLAGYIYADAGCGESTQDMVFAGHDIIGENGALLSESKPFADADGLPMAVTEIDVQKLSAERQRMNTFRARDEVSSRNIVFDMPLTTTALTRTFERHPFVPDSKTEREERCEAILAMQSFGLRKRIEHAHAKCAVIGISGGLDSCLALLVSVRAMVFFLRDREPTSSR